VTGESSGPATGRAKEQFSDKTILLTGGSGFLGKVVLATLLSRLATFRRLIVMLRAPDDAAARRRLEEEVLASEAFAEVGPDLIRSLIGEARLCAVAGDLGVDEIRARKGWEEIDTVIHCAASVSFEEPLDDALALNALGPSRLLKSLHDAGATPHFVHVSTAYVADAQVSLVAEDGPPHPGVGELEPIALMGVARGWRQAAEEESNLPAQLREFKNLARREASSRPGMDAEDRAEELKARWVKQQLARRGRRYAMAAGWPDTYALSKAVGERLVIESSEHTTVIRPSIIESAVRQPRPGWLEGIKVADPLILAYAAGGLTHLPGRASNRIDIVPVDYVANACVAAAAHPPGTGLRSLAVTSGARNALTLGELAGHIKTYFSREPLRRKDGSPIVIGDLAFVDRNVALRKTMRREWLAATVAKIAILPLPASSKRTLGRNAALAAQVTRMVKIYGPYTELDCVFDDRNTHAFARSLESDDRADFPFDTGEIIWKDYLEVIHLPQVHRLGQNRPKSA
jgi:alcohol-forming fatty acyl-CoA reductase